MTYDQQTGDGTWYEKTMAILRHSILNHSTIKGNQMDEQLKKQMQTLMYRLTKNAARHSYKEFLEDCGISDEDYEKIKAVWAEKLDIKPYC